MKKLFALLLIAVLTTSMPVWAIAQNHQPPLSTADTNNYAENEAESNDYHDNGYNSYENGYNGYNGYGSGYENGYNGYENGYNGYESGRNGYDYNDYENGYNNYGDQNGYDQTHETPVDYYPQQPSVLYQPTTPSLQDALGRVYYDFFTENNIKMVPLRLVAETMGYTVTWHEANRSITLQHGNAQVHSTVVIGHGYFEGQTLEVVPIIRNDRTFVPVSLFEILLTRYYAGN